MIDTLIRLGILLAIFASIFAASQVLLNVAWARGSHTRTVNKRLKMIAENASREEVMAALRKHQGSDFSHLPAIIANRLIKLQKALRSASVPFTFGQVLFAMGAGFLAIFAIVVLLVGASGLTLSIGVFVLAATLAFSAAILMPTMILNIVAQRRRNKMEEQFPISLDIFVRALRAGHPVASAIELLTKEMKDPIGSEFGLVADEVSYGAELTDSLDSMAERWDLEDIRMFVVSLSVQSETGGNLAEILENLTEVIRARASLYRKVRALSSEGRMTGWMLSILPVAAFLGLFAVNPQFYLAVADDPMFLTGFGSLLVMYIVGVLTIRAMIDIKV